MSAPELSLREPPGVLGRIVARTLQDVAAREAARPMAALADRPDAPRGFAAALRAPGLSLIAEYKPRSPSRGDLRPDASPQTVAAAYSPYAAAMSVLCDGPFFGGGLDKLRAARAVFPGPVICKDFVVTEYQIREAADAGADAVLLMACLLAPETLAHLLALARQVGLDALVETHDDSELAEALAAGADVVGVNSRDLRTLAIDLPAMHRRLDRVPADRVRVAESGLLTSDDVAAVRGRAEAALIGTSLMRADDPAAAIEGLGFPRCR